MKKILLSLILLIALTLIVGYVYLIGTKPTYEGNIKINGLRQEVVVKYDGYGVPHIYANNKEDAYLSLGYLQAQERLFQIEMIRRISTGKLSEVLGEEFLETDKLFRTLSIDQKSEALHQQFLNKDSEYKSAAQAYFDGINEFVRNGPTPIEFTAIGIEKTEFSVKDAYNAAGYMSFGFADGFRVDPLTSKIALTLGKEYLDDIGLHTHYDSAFIKSYIHDESLALTSMAKTIDQAKLPLFHGSNSWIVSADKSATGNPIFENDTHIPFSQPSVWYEAHIEYPGAAIYGHYLGGFPFAILGHNEFAAWGMTMFENDDVDLFQEKLNPENKNQVLRNNNWLELKERTEHIAIKDGEAYELKVQSSDHGPIITNILIADSVLADPVSVYWEFLHADKDILEPTYNLGLTSHISQARKAASEIAAPGLNIMYADKDGNIAWWAAARLPIRTDSSNSKLILDGTGSDDYLGYHPFTDNPQAENPPWGYVYSANNQPDTINGVLYPGYYRPLDRASRITALLESKPKWTVNDFKEMTADVKSAVALQVGLKMASVLSQTKNQDFNEIIDILNNWDGNHLVKDNGPTVYYNLLSWILFHAMADELGYDDYLTLANLEVMKRSYLMFIENENSIWWDDVATTVTESQSDIIIRAANSTLKTLTTVYGSSNSEDWRWGKVHTLNHGHALGQIDALKKYFDVGEYAVPGGNEVINNLMFKLDTTGLFPVFAGPSMRTIIDMGNIENAISINPTGQSGNFLSEHYSDQAQKFVDVEFRPQLMNPAQVDELKTSTLILSPNK